MPASVKWQPQQKYRLDFLHNDNLVEIEDVEFGYGDYPVLKGVNLTARRGQVIATNRIFPLYRGSDR